MYRPGQSFVLEFITSGAAGVAVNADSLPTASLAKNGIDDGAVTLVVVNIDAGRYKITGTIPISYAAGDSISVNRNATISSVVTKAIVLNAALDQGLDLTQVIPTSNTVQTVGDALNAARAQGFGPWSLVGTALTLFAADGTTPVHVFNVNSAITPTSRS